MGKITKHLARFLYVLPLLGLISCASVPTPEQARSQVPPKYIYANEYLRPTAARTTPVTVTRDSCGIGTLVRVELYVDGWYIAKLAEQESLTLYLKPGIAHFGARFSRQSMMAASPVERQFNIVSDRPSDVRVTINSEKELDLKSGTGLF